MKKGTAPNSSIPQVRRDLEVKRQKTHRYRTSVSSNANLTNPNSLNLIVGKKQAGLSLKAGFNPFIWNRLEFTAAFLPLFIFS